MTGYEKDIRLERKFADDIKVILAKYFIVQDRIADTKQGTDFLIFQIKPFRVAARLRTFKHFNTDNRRDEFTIRWCRPSGTKTEIDKIREGLVQYLFYGFVDKAESNLIQYFIADLNIFRKNESKPYKIYPNNPRDSDLAVYKINQFPEKFIKFAFNMPREKPQLESTDKKLTWEKVFGIKKI